ncbi:MAG: exodeoxyribonuclease VII small subunit [Bacilli bacterium]
MKFEEKMIKLEDIITQLENNNDSLEDSIKKYTEAMNLIKECDEQLKGFEENVNKLVNENGVLEDLEVE